MSPLDFNTNNQDDLVSMLSIAYCGKYLIAKIPLRNSTIAPLQRLFDNISY
jgi:hypothetical protein